MGRDLVCTFPAALETLEAADKYCDTEGLLSDRIYPLPAGNGNEPSAHEKRLTHTATAQPAIGAVSAAMLDVLGTFDVAPDAACGHSFGELTALYAAGRIDRRDFLRLAAVRGRLMEQAGADGTAERGCMAAVRGPLGDIEKLVRDMADVVLANRNSPDQGVISGAAGAVEKAAKRLQASGFKIVKLPVSAAFHSRFVRSAREPFADILGKIAFADTRIPVYANATGTPYPTGEDPARHLLAEQIVRPVNFVDTIENMFAAGITTFVEVGPKTVLSGLIRSILAGRDFQAVSMDGSSGRHSGLLDLAVALCQLAAAGHPVRLDRWEEPVARPEKQRMRIPISGANYRNPATTAPVSAGGRGAGSASGTRAGATIGKPASAGGQDAAGTSHRTENSRPALRKSRPDSPETTRGPAAANPPLPPKDRTMQHPDNIPSESTADAMQVIRSGLKSMQTLQMQTAEAHKLFLENQTEISRTLRRMMENAGQLAGISDAPDHAVRPPAPLHDMHQPAAGKTAPDASKDIADTETGTADTRRPSHLPETPPSAAAVTPPSGGTAPDIASTLLAVVSELTGYPADMLSTDMDIEADLGIDSIKRVEILSVLEEKMPHLPRVTPEHMGSLKTLGQIVDFLAAGSGGDAPASVPGATGPSDPRPAASTGSIASTLLAVVSELTGYPADMLSTDMDIEADLGIDSIKRVEILSVLEEKMPHLPRVTPEHMGSLKTLGQIVDFLSAPTSAPSETPSGPGGPAPAAPAVPQAKTDRPSSRLDMERKAVTVAHRSLTPTTTPLALAQAPVWVTDDGTGLSRAIVQALTSRRLSARLLDNEKIRQMADGSLPVESAAGLIIVQNPGADDAEQDLTTAFLLAKQAGPALCLAAGRGGAMFATVTRMDGHFGFGGSRLNRPALGGLCALAKTAALEWKGVRCRALDVAPDWTDTQKIAEAVAGELLHAAADGPVEVGLGPGTRVIPDLKVLPPPLGTVDLEPEDVIVISGGGRGITAAVAQGLAERFQPTLILLGRSPAPTEEPAWLTPLTDERSLKRAILENEFHGQTPSPKAIEHAFKARMANREIWENLKRIRSAGSRVSYLSADVRDPDRIRAIIRETSRRHGPIRGLIHAAGTIEDRLIVDKTPAQFQRVFQTKVRGLTHLLTATEQDPLKYLVLFSSVSARFGNIGQVDYAMANESLNKIAQQQAADRPDCRVIAVNWGPWEGGMVSPALQRKFRRKGIPLIPVEAGIESLVQQMAETGTPPVEVVIGAALADDRPETVKVPEPGRTPKDLNLTAQRTIDADRAPVLQSHVLNGNPVVPLALMAEWLGHGALHGNPGLMLQGLDDLRVLKGIRLNGGSKTIHLMAGRAVKNTGRFEVDVEIRDGSSQDDGTRVHAAARAILTEKLAEPPVFREFESIAAKPYTRSLETVYTDILFHGSALQGITKILGYSDRGMAARILPAPLPDRWLVEPMRSRWIGDPLVLDSAFQMAIVWCHAIKGTRCLPSYSASYRQYVERFPVNGVTAVMEVASLTDRKMKADFTFLDDGDSVVAQIKGVETVLNSSLKQAFKRRRAA